MIPLVIAHRGASAHAPENTLEAFRLAFDRFKVDMIEFDVRVTLDGIPVVIHDARLERTTNGAGYVTRHTLKQLKTLTIPLSPPSLLKEAGRGEGIKIPTLEEVLANFPGRSLAVEIKDNSRELVKSVMALVKKYKAEGHAVVGSKHHAVARQLRGHYPHIRRFLSQREVMGLYLDCRRNKPNPEKDPLGVVSVPPSSRSCRFDTPAFIDYVHQKEMKLVFWTINDADSMKSLWKKGADGILTDDPGLAKIAARS